jgi:hypothetical protein
MLGWRLSGVSLSWPWCAIMPGVPLTTDELLTTTRSVRKRLDLTRPVPLDLVQEGCSSSEGTSGQQLCQMTG